MAMAGEDIAAMIEEALPDAQVEMVDLLAIIITGRPSLSAKPLKA